MIRPRLPRMRPEASDMLRPRSTIPASGFLWHGGRGAIKRASREREISR
jgi:hypothetical protein